jgi:hypothetical protein
LDVEREKGEEEKMAKKMQELNVYHREELHLVTKAIKGLESSQAAPLISVFVVHGAGPRYLLLFLAFWLDVPVSDQADRAPRVPLLAQPDHANPPLKPKGE